MSSYDWVVYLVQLPAFHGAKFFFAISVCKISSTMWTSRIFFPQQSDKCFDITDNLTHSFQQMRNCQWNVWLVRSHTCLHPGLWVDFRVKKATSTFYWRNPRLFYGKLFPCNKTLFCPKKYWLSNEISLAWVPTTFCHKIWLSFRRIVAIETHVSHKLDHSGRSKSRRIFIIPKQCTFVNFEPFLGVIYVES